MQRAGEEREAGDLRLVIAPSTLIVARLILAAVGLVSGTVLAVRASRLGSQQGFAIRIDFRT